MAYPRVSVTRSARLWQSMHFLWCFLIFKFRFCIFGKDIRKWGCDLLNTSYAKAFDVDLFPYWKWLTLTTWWRWWMLDFCTAKLLYFFVYNKALMKKKKTEYWSILLFITTLPQILASMDEFYLKQYCGSCQMVGFFLFNFLIIS